MSKNITRQFTPNIAEFCKYCQTNGLTFGTIKYYRGALTLFSLFLSKNCDRDNVKIITTKHLQQFAIYLY